MPAERTGPDDEKVTINLGPVDLGRVDLLVAEGVFSSRTDFIRAAIRRQLDEHEDLVKEVVMRKSFVVGVLHHSKTDLERFRAKGEKVHVRVVGVYQLGQGVTKQLASDVLASVVVRGSMRGPKEVVAALKDLRAAAV